MNEILAGRLQCLDCGAALQTLTCPGCGRKYERPDGIYDFVEGDPEGIDALGDAVAERAEEMDPEELRREYESYVSEAEQDARTTAGRTLTNRLTDLSGVTVEIATGMGGLFGSLIDVKGAFPIATDISMDTLRQLRDQFREQLSKRDVSHTYVACDARDLPFRDGSIDAVVSAGGFNNIAQTERAIAEAARVLRPGVRLLALNMFVASDTESAQTAVEYGVETGYVQDEFLAATNEAGFAEIDVETIASVEATGNPYDVLPEAGDTQTYAIVNSWVESSREER